MKFFKPVLILSFVIVLLGVALTLGTYLYIKADLPSVVMLKDVRLQTPMRIYTQDGKLISQFGIKRRIPLTLKDVPETLVHAVLATEDSRFYQHPGIDPIGMSRALINLIVTGEKGQGGSTLTMQLARGFFLSRDKTYIRKIREIIIAWHIEQLLSKDEILELYLNKVELGHRSFGFGAAAQVYYGKTVNELSLAQIATIAGLPQAPSILNPISRPERSIARRRIVLLRMLDENYINQQQFEQAAAAPVTAKKHGAELELDAPYLADIIYNEMVELYGKEEAETGGYHVIATVPSTLQEAAQKAIQRNLHDYDERHGYRGPVRQLWQTDMVKAQEVAERLSEQEKVIYNSLNKAWSEEQMLELLADFPTFSPMNAAIVVKVNERDIVIFDRQGKYNIIDWDGLDWARTFITDSRQGPSPTVASDILSEGALILIRQRDDDRHWQLAQYPQASSALVALNPHNGAAQAVVGGYSFYQSQFNRATQAKRQVGSNIKPFIYSAALANGFTTASVINDAPITQWQQGSGNAWRPENSPAEYDGPIRMRVALGKSKNVVSIRLLRDVGLDSIVDYLTRFGFELSEIPRDETVSLGSGSHTPLEVVTAMSTIANGGFLIQPHFIERIEDDYDQVLWQSNPVIACEPCVASSATESQDGEADVEALLAAEFSLGGAARAVQRSVPQAPRVIREENAFLVADMMRTAARGNGSTRNKTYWRGTGWRASNLIGNRKDIAGKTGTTNDSGDAWFSGFTPDLVATTWVGFDNVGRKLGYASPNQNLINKNPKRYNYIGNAMVFSESGAMAAQPAWIRFMQKALEGVEEKKMPMPGNIVTVRIDQGTGKLTQKTDHTSMFEYFAQGTEPKLFVTDGEFIDPAEDEDSGSKQEEEIF